MDTRNPTVRHHPAKTRKRGTITTSRTRTAPPFALEGIDHVLLLVSDLAPALEFYRDVLGCRVADELPEYGMVQLRAGTALIDLVDIGARAGQWARPDVRGGRNLDHLCIAISSHDEQALRQHLAAHSIEIVEEGVHGGARGESLSLYIRDPSGNTIELKGPPS
jgi:catechol 2,3-dioxygenase-like lactoylglutathione lyase family enzyme